MAASNIVQIIIQAMDSASNVFKTIGDNSGRMGDSVSAAMDKSTKDIAKAQTAVIGLKDNLISSIGSIKGLIANLGMIGIGSSIVAAAQSWSEAVYNLRRAIGGTAEDASKLLAIGKYAGVGTEEAAGYFAKFGKAISASRDEMQKAAAEGKRSNDMFSRIGLSFDQINNKNVGDVFTLVADKMRNMADGADKNRVAMQLFGGSSSRLAEMLNLSKEQLEAVTEAARESGFILNDETAEGWHKLTLEMKHAMSIGTGLAVQIGNSMLPVLRDKVSTLKAIGDGYRTLSPEIQRAIGLTLIATGEFGAYLIGAKAIAAFAPAFGASLLGPWGVAIAAIGLAIKAAMDYFSLQNKVASYDPKAVVRKIKGHYYKEVESETPPNLLGMTFKGTRLQPLSDAELEEQKKFELDPAKYSTQKLLDDLEKLKEPSTILAPPYIDTSAAARTAEREAEKLERANAQARLLIADLERRITDTSGSVYESGMAKITAEVTKMQNQVTQIGNAGGDTSGLADKIAQYQQVAADKVRETWQQAWTDIKNQTALIGAQLIDDRAAQADIEYQIELDKIAKEKETRLKAIAVDNNDQGAKTAVDEWAKGQQNFAAQKRDTNQIDAKLKEYRDALTYNTLLINLEGKTRQEVDALRQKDLAAEIAYLQQKLKETSLNAEQRLALQKSLNDAMNQQYELDAMNYDTAFSAAFRNIQNRQINYAQTVEQSWDQVYASAQDNLSKMALEGQSATKALENFFKDMVESIENMFLKMWADKYIMGPLQQLFGQILGVPTAGTPSASAAGSTKQLSSIPSSAEVSPIQTFAAGGYNPGGWSLVGEEGPELAYFGNPAHIYTANQTQALLNQSAAAPVIPKVNVTVINKTGQQVQVSQQASYDPATQSTLVQMVIDGVQNNVAGSRDFFFGRG
ncbi:hypothetical protein [Sporomusa termitida]|uniref:Uncharacterized protein n=1 Tax=Sporomusa termitida TaxID=2377 RepID=A0A517DVI1_9FIRM|nr:hypothetical protein [Sporomusa termitida]QDR81341.1 hypothetical protein SPTER_27200 [Sporomusa termitida]